MSKALGINPEIGLEELLQVNNSNDFDVVYQPMLQGPGGVQGGTMIKPAPVHEGAQTTFENPNDLPGNVSVEQLADFRDEFERQTNGSLKGMNVLKKDTGEVALVPHWSAMEAEVAGNGEALHDSGVSLDRAIDSYITETGDTLALPTAY